ncbi:MAG: SPOR domain-containing protein [Cytophagales bacterium]|nr:SPOR domain-containing protein [Cytophagales bacterium]
MADDSTNEEEPKERKNEYFDDDEDFGLPDLEYDELDDEDEPLEEELDLEVEVDGEDESLEELEIEDAPAEPEPELIDLEDNDVSGELDLDESYSEPEASEDSTDIGDISEEDLDDIEISDEDLEGVDFDDIDLSDISEEDLQLDDEDTDFYEEESYEDFEGESAGADIFESEGSSSGSSEDLSAEELAERENKGVEFKYSDPQSRNSFTRIVVIGTVVIAVLGLSLWFAFFRTGGNEQIAEKPKQEQPAKPKPEPPKEDPKPVPSDPKPEPEQVKPDPQPLTVEAGEITRLSAKTGQAYVIIGSFVDEDLAGDYAQELADDGKSPTIIPPFDDHRFYRVAIASYSTFADANNAVNNYKGEFGDDIWALRY